MLEITESIERLRWKLINQENLIHPDLLFDDYNFIRQFFTGFIPLRIPLPKLTSGNFYRLLLLSLFEPAE